MTVEEIAAMALQGMLSNPLVIDAFKESELPMVEAVSAAALAYAKELKRQVENDFVQDTEYQIINE